MTEEHDAYLMLMPKPTRPARPKHDVCSRCGRAFEAHEPEEESIADDEKTPIPGEDDEVKRAVFERALVEAEP